MSKTATLFWYTRLAYEALQMVRDRSSEDAARHAEFEAKVRELAGNLLMTEVAS